MDGKIKQFFKKFPLGPLQDLKAIGKSWHCYYAEYVLLSLSVNGEKTTSMKFSIPYLQGKLIDTDVDSKEFAINF